MPMKKRDKKTLVLERKIEPIRSSLYRHNRLPSWRSSPRMKRRRFEGLEVPGCPSRLVSLTTLAHPVVVIIAVVTLDRRISNLDGLHRGRQ